MEKLRPYLELIRVPNVITSAVDVFAGMSVVSACSPGYGNAAAMPYLVFASCALYAGGVALNDVFDIRVDAWERPERPIPSGRISRCGAGLLAVLLLLTGVLLSSRASTASLMVSLALLFAIIMYNGGIKKAAGFGSFTMGLCRALNFCLGLTLLPGEATAYIWVAAYPLLHTSLITSVSRGENEGMPRLSIAGRVILLWLLAISLFALTLQISIGLLPGLIFAVLYFCSVTFAFVPAILKPVPEAIKRGIKYGVLSLVVLDAALVAVFNPWTGLWIVGLLFFLAVITARWLAVT